MILLFVILLKISNYNSVLINFPNDQVIYFIYYKTILIILQLKKEKKVQKGNKEEEGKDSINSNKKY